MLRILGSPKSLCDGITRRDLLHIGGLSVLGLGWEQLRPAAVHAGVPLGFPGSGTGSRRGGELSSAETRRSAQMRAEVGPPTADACILLFLFGSPPQHETFDPKPAAPAEIQGELRAISTSLPGVCISEGLPRIARIADRLTIVRSMTHPYPVHGVAYALSGMPTYTPAIEASPRDPQHWPFMGSIVEYLTRRRAQALNALRASRSTQPGANVRASAQEMPQNVGLPWQFGTKSTVPTLAGPYAAFLGSNYDPVWTDFSGSGTQVAPKLTDGQTEEVRDPFLSIDAADRFSLSPACRLPEDVPSGRLSARQLLLEQFDRVRRRLDEVAAVRSFTDQQQRAYALIGSQGVREALDLDREPRELREQYGLSLFGQACLAARRLVEAGCRFVSVFWDPYGPFGGSVWDTHANHFPRLKNYLLPVFDQSYSALITDLEQRGLLDRTLVLCTSEHGRTPQIDSKPRGAARHHWSRAYCSVFCGGGMARGRVVGRTDAIAGDVEETPISPKDMQATAYFLLGIDPTTIIADQLGRPHPIAGDGQVRRELLA